MVRAFALLPSPPESFPPVAGRTLEDHLRWTLDLAGLDPAVRSGDEMLGEAPCIVWDGRFAAVAPESLAGLARLVSGGHPLLSAAPVGRSVCLRAAGGAIAAIGLPRPPSGANAALLLASPRCLASIPLTAEESATLEEAPSREAICRTVSLRWLRALGAEGPAIEAPETLRVDTTVRFGAGCRLGPGVTLLGRTELGADVEVATGSRIADSAIGDGARIRPYTVCDGARVGPGAIVGPFAHLRPDTVLERGVHVGNFVEVKNAVLREGAKANHLSYLGDASVGARTNIGAGTITCNYDGFSKHRTEIGADVFVGSDTCLVAPVTVGDGTIIGAGSVIAQDLPEDAVAVNRAPLRLNEGRASSLKARYRARAAPSRDSS